MTDQTKRLVRMAHRASTRLEAAKKVGDLVEQKQAETVLRLVEGLLRRLK